MASEAAAVIDRTTAFGPWLWSPRMDLAAFGGSALLALALVLLGRALGWSDGGLPEWGFIVFVIAIDVAHVYATLFRTYFDSAELARHRVRYVLVPAVVYLCGVALYTHGALSFWRVLAYLALFHFVRQQAGWVAVYRARAGQHNRLDEIIDDAAIYSSTLYPVLHWHARIGETEFAWFLQGDFVDLSELAQRLLPVLHWIWMVSLLGFGLRQLQSWFFARALALGKLVVVTTTALAWYIGIVATNSDFDFTVTNVVVHGVPYCVLLFMYARKRSAQAPHALVSQVVASGVSGFIALLLALAFIEEAFWDRLVWHERPWLFGTSNVELGATAAVLIVPLLALPQGIHYVLDGLLWRRSETRKLAAQRAALGFAERRHDEADGLA
jgi:hypothetical protein